MSIARTLACTANVRAWVLSRALRNEQAERSAARALQRHGFTLQQYVKGVEADSVHAQTINDVNNMAETSGLLLDESMGDAAARANLAAYFIRRAAPVVSFNAGSDAIAQCDKHLHVRTAHATLDDVVQEVLGCRSSEVMKEGHHTFGPHLLYPSQLFYSSRHSVALVNIKPVLPGHVLVITRRPCPRFIDLGDDELTDLWLTARKVGRALEKHYRGTALTLAIQDGPDAGQSVPHVHIHILPRAPADLPDNDAIYGMIEESGVKEGESFGGKETRATPVHAGIALDPGVLPPRHTVLHAQSQSQSHPSATGHSSPDGSTGGREGVQQSLGDGAVTPIVAALTAARPVGESGTSAGRAGSATGTPPTSASDSAYPGGREGPAVAHAAGAAARSTAGRPQDILPAEQRVPRTAADMEREAATYRALLGWQPDLL